MVNGADAVRNAVTFFRDLGVTELYLDRASAPYAAAPADDAQSLAVGESASLPFAATPGGALSGDSLPSLASLAAIVASCRKCGLCSTRKQTVFSDGSDQARIMFVGEAPGADEDAKGIPFVGRAGQLLTKMIEDGMGIPRQDVYIANILKCRPPDNRNPEPAEIASCRGYLEEQIAIVKPEVLVALGKFAAQFLLETDEGIMRLRGRWGTYRGIPVMPTFHPSFLLRQPAQKREAWEDLLKVLAKLGIEPPAAKKGVPR